MPVTDQGINFDRYMLVPRTLIFLMRGSSILLLKGAETKRLWAGLYNGIGGHIEQGEDILNAASRELFEETGLLSPDIHLCGILTIDTQINPGVGIFIFCGHCPDGQTAASKEGILEWVGTAEIESLPLVSDLPQLLPKIFGYTPGSPPFFAHSSYDQSGNLVISFV